MDEENKEVISANTTTNSIQQLYDICEVVELQELYNSAIKFLKDTNNDE